jgi:hypothetical protein
MDDLVMWADRLSKAIALALSEFSAQNQEEIEVFAIDCHPWNGQVNLAILTTSEAKADPLLVDAAELAAWKHYGFESQFASWARANELCSSMRETYYRTDDRAALTDGYLQACATAAMATVVRNGLSAFNLSERFRISVCHPDGNREYVIN